MWWILTKGRQAPWDAWWDGITGWLPWGPDLPLQYSLSVVKSPPPESMGLRQKKFKLGWPQSQEFLSPFSPVCSFPAFVLAPLVQPSWAQSLHLQQQQGVILLSRCKRNWRALVFLTEQHPRPGLIYNYFYKDQVLSRKKTNVLEARRQDPQRVGETWFLSSPAGPLPSCATGITGTPWPFAPGTPWSSDEPHMLPLTRGSSFSEMQLELGKLLWWRKGLPFTPAEMPAARLT